MPLTEYTTLKLAVPLCAVLALGVQSVRAQCTDCNAISSKESSPAYHIALKYKNSNGTLVVHVATTKKELSREELVALACKLRRDFSGEEDVFIRIFDNVVAAKKYASPSQQHKPVNWETYAKSFKAFYVWKPKENSHWIVWDFNPLVENSEHKSEDLCLKTSPRPSS